MCNNKKNILQRASLIIMKTSKLRPHLGYHLLGSSSWMPVYDKNWHQMVQAKAIREPHSSTTPSPKQTPMPVQGTAAQCTLWILGLWAGPATSEVKWSSVCDLYYILLLPTSTSLLHITWPVITYCYSLLLRCYYIIITHYYIIHYHVLLQFCYCTAITSLLHIITSFIITCYYIFCSSYYTVITSLLRIRSY